MKALVVKNSSALRAPIAATLGEFGFEVHVAASAWEAMAMLRNEGPFSLCLVGWDLPDMWGTDLVRLIRGGMVQQGAPRILMITGKTSRAQVVEALSAGCDECLAKPFSSDMLVGKLSILRLLPRFNSPLTASRPD